MREEGPKALFKGITPIMLRAFPANAVSYHYIILYCLYTRAFAIYVDPLRVAKSMRTVY